MKQTVKDVIQQLEKMNPNDVIFSLIFTKEDIKAFEHYDPVSNEIVYPYNDELAEEVLSYMDGYDSIYEYVYKCMNDEISYQVDKLSRQENIKVEPASY